MPLSKKEKKTAVARSLCGNFQFRLVLLVRTSSTTWFTGAITPLIHLDIDTTSGNKRRSHNVPRRINHESLPAANNNDQLTAEHRRDDSSITTLTTHWQRLIYYIGSTYEYLSSTLHFQQKLCWRVSFSVHIYNSKILTRADQYTLENNGSSKRRLPSLISTFRSRRSPNITTKATRQSSIPHSQ